MNTYDRRRSLINDVADSTGMQRGSALILHEAIGHLVKMAYQAGFIQGQKTNKDFPDSYTFRSTMYTRHYLKDEGWIQ